VELRLLTSESAAGGNYAAIAALTNIPAMIIAAGIYEIFLTDSDRGSCALSSARFRRPLINLACVDPAIPRASLEFAHVSRNHGRKQHRRRETGVPDLEKQKDTPVVEGKSVAFINGSNVV
jgi:hypothetical protein